MKELKILFGALLFGAVLSFSSCSKNEDATVTTSEEPEYMINDLNVIETPTINDGVNSDFAVSEEVATNQNSPCERIEKQRLENHKGCNCKDRNRCPDHKNAPGKPEDTHSLSAVLHHMDLTAEQKASIKTYMDQHCDCVRDHLQKIRTMHAEILRKFNEERAELVKAFRNNRITKAEFEAKIKNLHGRLLNAIKDNNPRQLELRALRICREQLFKNINSVLTDDQKVMWHRWVENHR